MAELGRAQGVMPRAKRSPAKDRGDAMAIIERLHRAGWSIGDVPLRGERGGCAKTDDSCWSKSERGRGGWRCASEEGPGAVLSHANGGVLPVGWAGKPWTRAPAATGQG